LRSTETVFSSAVLFWNLPKYLCALCILGLRAT
jgi:hypothetical protein